MKNLDEKFHRFFIKKESIAIKHRKSCLTLGVITTMQIKSTPRYQYMPNRMTKFKTLIIPRVDKNVNKMARPTKIAHGIAK